MWSASELARMNCTGRSSELHAKTLT